MGLNACCCTVPTFTLTVRAGRCGNVPNPGVAVVVKDGSGTTVATCTTTGTTGFVAACVVSVPAGTLTVTATNSHGLTLTQTTTVVGSGNVLTFSFLDAIPVSVTDCGGGSTAGAIVHISAPGWSTTGTTAVGGGVTIFPTADVTGLTVTAFVTFGGATSASKTINPTLANCGSFTFNFASKATVAVTGCSGLALAGASATFTGPAGETGAGTTDALGHCSATMTPIIANVSGSFTVSVSKSRFVTASGGAAVCATATVALSPAAGYVCACGCADPLNVTLTATDPLGAVTLSYDVANDWWYGTAPRAFTTTYDNSTGACNNPQPATLTVAFVFTGCRLFIKVAECSNIGNSVPCRSCTTPTTGALGLMSFANALTPTVVCPPSFDWTMAYPMGSEATVDDRPYEQIYGAAGTVVNFGVTE